MSVNAPRVYTLSETAELHDMSKGYLSRRLKEGKEAKGHDLRPYAAYDADGHVKHFVFPDDYDFPIADEVTAETSTEETHGKMIPAGASEQARMAPTKVSGAEPVTVEIYERQDWLSHREAIKLMAEYIPIDYEYDATHYSKVSKALDYVAVNFKEERASARSQEDNYYLEGKVLAVIRQIQQEGIHDALWTIGCHEWQDHVHKALGLGAETGLDVEPRR